MRIDHRVRLGQALASALDPFHVGVAVVDARSLRFILVNDALASILGTPAEELVALGSALERIAPEDVSDAEERFTAGVACRFSLRLLHANGEAIELEASARPFDVERGGRAMAMVVRDRRRDGESDALRAALEEATSAIRTRDEFFSIASHELRTPLTSVRLHSQVLARVVKQEAPDLARVRQSVGEVERHSERLTTMVDQLLDMSRIRSGRLILEREEVDLAAIVREVAGRFAPEAATTGATIIIDGERAVLGRWDPLRIDQVVTNLVSNALKYGEGNPIAIELRASSARVMLTVRDYGPGIAEEQRERIFEAFERANVDPRVRGSGLGLSIVRRLVEAHGGTVGVATGFGRGAVFIVDLPRSG